MLRPSWLKPKPTQPSRETESHRAIGWAFDHPLVQLTQYDCLTGRDLGEGMLVIGSPGSGKTSTTGRIVLTAAIAHGWSVVIFTAKPDDLEPALQIARNAGRMRDVVVVEPGGQHHFNLLRYELGRTTPGGGNSFAAAKIVLDLVTEGQPRPTASETSQYFQTQTLIRITSVIDAVRLAGQPVSLPAILAVSDSGPRSFEEIGSDAWLNSACGRILRAADTATEGTPDRPRYEEVANYFLQRVPSMNDRTRGDIDSTVQGGIFELTRPPFNELIDSPRGCSFTPDLLEGGMILIVNTPSGVFGPVGRAAAIALKRVVKDYLRRRRIDSDRSRPVLFYADECQTIVSRDDAEFFQVSRSNRVAPCFLTQSFENIEVALGGDAAANSLANALTLHVYHATSGRTAELIERRIAQSWRQMESTNYSGHDGADGQHARGPGINVSKHLYPQVLSSELSRLRTGGPLNRGIVDAIAFKPGRIWHASQAPFLRIQWQQS